MERLDEDTQLLEGFRAYIRDKRVLIADANATTRTNVARCLGELGGLQGNMDLVTGFEAAQEELNSRKHKVIVCEYDLGNRCGLDLLDIQQSLLEKSKDTLFIMVTANTSQSAVAQAVEEDVDTYIIKPFSSLTLRQRILAVAKDKLFPNPYRKKIMEGKEFLFAANYDAATTAFNEAMTLSDSPTLACFYLGQTNVLKQKMREAELDYRNGLSLNRIHYKCLVGLFELFMKQEQFSEAYDVVKKIANYFPANPKRLGSVLRLAIMTKNYTDIERYYQTFVNLDQRSPEIIRYVCAGLVICGKYYLQQKNAHRAVELFKKASVSAKRDSKLLREVITSLTEYNLYDHAQSFMKDFPPESLNTADFKIAQYFVSNKYLSAPQLVDQGKALIAELEKKEPILYKMVILRMFDAGLAGAAEEFYEKSLRECPSAKADLEQFWKTRKLETWRAT